MGLGSNNRFSFLASLNNVNFGLDLYEKRVSFHTLRTKEPLWDCLELESYHLNDLFAENCQSHKSLCSQEVMNLWL